MRFGEAVELARQGRAVAREGWNGKRMWVSMSPGTLMATREEKPWAPAAQKYFATQSEIGISHINILPSMIMRTAGGDILMGWLASQTDMLADDWNEVEPS